MQECPLGDCIDEQIVNDRHQRLARRGSGTAIQFMSKFAESGLSHNLGDLHVAL
jgi:hypothetical protein